MAVLKLSQIASGGAFVPATDALVTVRSGTTDNLTTIPIATSLVLGLVKGDGATISISGSGVASLNLANANIWTGIQTFSSTARTTGSAAYFLIDSPADTTLTASVEAVGLNFNLSATRQFATGALTTQREMLIQAPTYGFVGASTITNAITLDVASPIAGTNATLTNSSALRAVASSVAHVPIVIKGAGGGATTQTGHFLEAYEGDGTTLRAAISAYGDPKYAPGFINYGQYGCVVWDYASNFILRADSSGGLRYDIGGNQYFLLSTAIMGNRSTGGIFSFSPSTATAYTSGDVGIESPAAGVMAATDGQRSGNITGWFQQAGNYRTTTAPTNATVAMSNLSDLTTTVKAGRKYIGKITIFAKNSTGADGLAFDFNGGTATMTSFQAGIDGTPIGGTLGTTTSTSISTALTLTVVSTSDQVYEVDFGFVVNAAGTLIPRFAEVAHTTGTATVEINSYIMVTDCVN